ncbi:MAG TPA: hypothetical protein VHG08_14380 [Longimicrobium sp.]|nr:hypothetical protein [Longimicrobium sp.]
MASLQIDLQNGFDGEPVTLRVNGREVYRNADVRTNYAVSHADSMRVEVPDGPVDLQVVLEKRGTSARISQTVAGTAFLGIEVEPSGEVVHHWSDGEFEYL